MQFGMVVLCTAVGLLGLFDANSTWSLVYGITCLAGVGVGCLYGSALIGLQASAEPRDIAVVTGLCNFARILGGAVGVAISSAVVNSSLAASLPQGMPAEYAAKVIDSSLYVRNGLPPQYFEVAIDCYAYGLQLLWRVMTGLTGVGVITSFFIKHSSLRKGKHAEVVVSDTAAKDDKNNEKSDDKAVVIEVHDTTENLKDKSSTEAWKPSS